MTEQVQSGYKELFPCSIFRSFKTRETPSIREILMTHLLYTGRRRASDYELFSFELGATTNSRPVCYSRQFRHQIEIFLVQSLSF